VEIINIILFTSATVRIFQYDIITVGNFTIAGEDYTNMTSTKNIRNNLIFYFEGNRSDFYRCHTHFAFCELLLCHQLLLSSFFFFFCDTQIFRFF
jgi:hypothetical protein